MSATIQAALVKNMIRFKGRHLQKEMILQSVCWYLTDSLNYRDIEAMMNLTRTSLPSIPAPAGICIWVALQTVLENNFLIRAETK